jgi:hypothetical protein
MKISELQEARGDLGQNTNSILMRNREKRATEKHAAKLVGLNKNDAESKSRDATTTYPTEKEAREYHARIVRLNPTRNIRHNLYVDNKLVQMLDTTTLTQSASADNLNASGKPMQENASSGGTSSGSIASVANPLGEVMKRPSLFGYVPSKSKRKSTKSKSHHK